MIQGSLRRSFVRTYKVRANVRTAHPGLPIRPFGTKNERTNERKRTLMIARGVPGAGARRSANRARQNACCGVCI
jgi:hypothetical protein